MALPTLDSVFASAADLPRRQMLAKWLVNLQYSGSVADYWTLPEHYLWAKIAVAAGAPRSEADYISLPKNYIWSDLYNAVSGSSGQTIDRGEKEAIGWIAAAVRGDAGNPEAVATYINWPWRYQVASIITALAVESDAQSFITTSGATDVEGIDRFVKGIKALGLWNNMVCWPLRSSQNAGFGDTVHSLGGLGTFNGTRVGGPTWTADGVDINAATSQSITFSSSPFTDFANGHSVFAIFKPTGPDPTSSTASLQWVLKHSANLARLGHLGTGGTVNVLATMQRSVGIAVSGTLLYAAQRNLFGVYRYNANNNEVQYRSTAGTTAGSSVSAFNATLSGTLTLTADIDGRNTSAFLLVTTPQFNLSASLQTALESLYKSTLGAGLGLP